MNGDRQKAGPCGEVAGVACAAVVTGLAAIKEGTDESLSTGNEYDRLITCPGATSRISHLNIMEPQAIESGCTVKFISFDMSHGSMDEGISSVMVALLIVAFWLFSIVRFTRRVEPKKFPDLVTNSLPLGTGVSWNCWLNDFDCVAVEFVMTAVAFWILGLDSDRTYL